MIAESSNRYIYIISFSVLHVLPQRMPMTYKLLILIQRILINSVPLRTECYDFPESDSKGPDVGGSGELGVSDGLDSHPANGQPSRLSVLVDQFLFLIKLAIEAKIGDLYNFICREEEVPAGDISVNHTNAGQVVLGGAHTS